MATEGEPSVTMGGSFQQPPEEENEDNAPNSSNFVDEREDLKQELSMTMGISDIDRDLMKVDDTGIYALIAQLSHKILNLEKQLQNPPWFDKVMENVNRIDQFGEKMEIVQEAVTSLSRRINGIHGEEESDEEDAEDAPTATATATAAAAAAATATADTTEEKKERKQASTSKQQAVKDITKPKAVKNEDVQKQIREIKREIEQRERNLRLENANSFSEYDMKNQRLLQKLQAEYPSISEFDQYKEFSTERHKKLKMQVQQKQSDIQRLVDTKFNAEFETVMKWKETFSTSTLDRMKSVEELVRSFNEDLTYLRGGVDEHVHMLEERITDNQMWCQKKFSDIETETKKQNTKIHEIRAELKEHTGQIEQIVAKAVETDETVESNKEEGFAQFMQLQMAIDEIKEVDVGQDEKHEALAARTEELENRTEVHDGVIEETQTAVAKHSDELLQLQHVGEKTAATLKTIREVELVEVKQVAADATQKVQEMVEVKVAEDIKTIKGSNEVMATEIKTVKQEVAVLPTKIEEVKEKVVTITEKQDAQKAEANDSGKAVDELAKKLESVCQEATAIKALKDKSIELSDGLSGLEEALRVGLKRSEDNEKLMSAVKENSDVLERKLMKAIGNVKLVCRDETEKKIEEMRDETKMVEKRTKSIVQEFLESNPKLLGKRGAAAASKSGAMGGVSLGSGDVGGSGGVSSMMDDAAPRRGSVIGLTSQEIHEYSLETADQATEIIFEYEEMVSQRTYIVEVPPEVRARMTDLCQDMSEFISSKADQEAIDRMIRGNPEDIVYTDEQVDEARMAMLGDWMGVVERKLNAKKGNLGKIRGEARTLISKKLTDAIDMALSKHDQVLITGHSRLGRVQLPTCVACDRPLANKQRAREMIAEKGGQNPVKEVRGAKGVYERAAPVPKIGRLANARGGGPETNNLAIEKMAMEHAMSSEALVGTQRQQQRPVTAGEVDKKRPIFGGNNGALENSYVYKSGFKMPHKGEGSDSTSKHQIGLPRVGFGAR